MEQMNNKVQNESNKMEIIKIRKRIISIALGTVLIALLGIAAGWIFEEFSSAIKSILGNYYIIILIITVLAILCSLLLIEIKWPRRVRISFSIFVILYIISIPTIIVYNLNKPHSLIINVSGLNDKHKIIGAQVLLPNDTAKYTDMDGNCTIEIKGFRTKPMEVKVSKLGYKDSICSIDPSSNEYYVNLKLN